MKKRRIDRLQEIEKVLWEFGVFGATKEQIADLLGLSPGSYLRSLLRQLIDEGKATSQPETITPYQPLKYYGVQSSAPHLRQRNSSTPLYEPEKTWMFDLDHCFLCGIKLTNDNRTDEHVIPRWMQRKYNLYNQRLTLLNGTDILYRKLIIPCCSTCNTEYLGELENRIQKAHDRGFEEFNRLPRILIFQWMAKIFYGLLFRELSLLADRTNPDAGSIFSEDQLREFRTLHRFLQSVRLPIVFRGFQPWSIFVVQTLSFDDERNFDYRDSFEALMFSVRMGGIGIIACLEDAGVQEYQAGSLMEAVRAIKLNPIQFDELVARITYGRLLMNRVPVYLINTSTDVKKPTLVVLSPLLGLSSKPLFNAWDQEVYAHILGEFWAKYDISMDKILYPQNAVRSMLMDQDKHLLQFDQNGEVIDRIENKSLSKYLGGMEGVSLS